MPLAELIATVYDKGVTTKTVQNLWQNLIDNFGNEIDILINVNLADIANIDSKISLAIKSFRNNSINIIPGGGGKYGRITFEKQKKITTLDSF